MLKRVAECEKIDVYERGKEKEIYADAAGETVWFEQREREKYCVRMYKYVCIEQTMRIHIDVHDHLPTEKLQLLWT